MRVDCVGDEDGRLKQGTAVLPGTRALLVLVIGMAVLIAAGVVVVVVTLVHRTFGSGVAAAGAAPHVAPGGAVSLGEPPGSRIVSVSATDGRLALLVSGGGVPDRLVLLDARDGASIATIRLGPAAAVPR